MNEEDRRPVEGILLGAVLGLVLIVIGVAAALL